MKRLLAAILLLTMLCNTHAGVRYTGSALADPSRHDGGLSPIVGVHNIQTMRAIRGDNANDPGWTYNHQPMLAYWHDRYYMHYLSNPAEEHIGAGRTMMQTSADGYRWTDPVVLFPEYRVPNGFTKDSVHYARELYAVMHQRVGWYVSKSDRLLATGNYGIAVYPKDDPNDGNGIGRVVREVYVDGSLGPIYFIYYNHGFDESNTDYPFYTRSKDKGFKQACREMIDNPLWRMQWVEEADRGDTILPLATPYKAFCWYTLPDGRIAGLWKHALSALSDDGGLTWPGPVGRAPGFVNSNAKIWGQRLTDGMYATVYNPAEYRWPLAVSLSGDGQEYTTLNLIQGEVPPMRYGGQYKSYGPQYVRGIQEGNGCPSDSNLHVTYSMNKEDIWVAHVPVPLRTLVTAHANDDFRQYSDISELTEWGIHSPIYAPVELTDTCADRWLTLTDSDPYDMAVAERMIPASRDLKVSFDLIPSQADRGLLQIVFLDSKGTACARIDLTDEGIMRNKGGARYGKVTEYQAGRIYHISVEISLDDRQSTVYVDGQKRSTRMLFAPVDYISRIQLRTGAPWQTPTIDTDADIYDDLPSDKPGIDRVRYRIGHFATEGSDAGRLLMGHKSPLREYVDYFNSMEDENIVQAIPNAQGAEWMEQNIPMFECPDRDFEEIYYYRWWSLRKHIKQTPVGYGMTEFLVDRKYADKYNLISCALGHHIRESRWLRDPLYLNGIINIWYRGNDGEPMERMMNFSSWTPASIYNRFKVTADTAFVREYYRDMDAEYARWEKAHRLPSGLYWQRDVNDGMEESISGGRKMHNARPSINSYMYGNAYALAQMAELLADSDGPDRDYWVAKKALYTAKADTLSRLLNDSLWCAADRFYETVRPDSVERYARVREAIGYLPWYFNMPGTEDKAEAWLQIEDKQGFAAPYGLTTAERRHPAFRTHGVGRCEWDGAIWPFATSQTLTALANYLNSVDSPVVSDSTYYDQMCRYVESMHHRGRPYIGEYLDETTGYWLKGDQERSRYYNHSTFADLVITGLVGLRPRADNVIDINPLLPGDVWPWFCLDRIPYHGHQLTVIWDADGTRYHLGRGLTLMVDGVRLASRPTIGRLSVTI